MLLGKSARAPLLTGTRRTVQLQRKLPTHANLVLQWRAQQVQTSDRCVRLRSRPHRPRRFNSPKGLSRLPQDSKPSKMAAVQSIPKDVSKLGQEVKLFGRWDTQECVSACAFLCASEN